MGTNSFVQSSRHLCSLSTIYLLTVQLTGIQVYPVEILFNRLRVLSQSSLACPCIECRQSRRPSLRSLVPLGHSFSSVFKEDLSTVLLGCRWRQCQTVGQSHGLMNETSNRSIHTRTETSVIVRDHVIIDIPSLWRLGSINMISYDINMISLEMKCDVFEYFFPP